MSEPWPNHSRWSALRTGPVPAVGATWTLDVVDCGLLYLPSGRLVACDPFAGMSASGNGEILVPPGRYPVRVTRAQLQGPGERPHIREAYASLILSDAPEVLRRVLSPAPPGVTREPLADPDEFYGFGVDAGAACFVDAEALASGMPDPSRWHDELFDHPGPDAWFHIQDDPARLPAGLANIPLPLARDGENIVIFHSGWGDGMYPLIGGYDTDGQLVAVHIDFLVVPDEETIRRAEEAAATAAAQPPAPSLWARLRGWFR